MFIRDVAVFCRRWLGWRAKGYGNLENIIRKSECFLTPTGTLRRKKGKSGDEMLGRRIDSDPRRPPRREAASLMLPPAADRQLKGTYNAGIPTPSVPLFLPRLSTKSLKKTSVAPLGL